MKPTEEYKFLDELSKAIGWSTMNAFYWPIIFLHGYWMHAHMNQNAYKQEVCLSTCT